MLKPATRLLQLFLRPGSSDYAAQRAANDRLFGRVSLPPGVRPEIERVGALELLRVTPADEQSSGIVLYLHGGAYVLGSLTMYRPVLGAIAQQLQLPVVAPEYRLAPEHPFPAALDDALAAYTMTTLTSPATRPRRWLSPDGWAAPLRAEGRSLADLVQLQRGRLGRDLLPAVAFGAAHLAHHSSAVNGAGLSVRSRCLECRLVVSISRRAARLSGEWARRRTQE